MQNSIYLDNSTIASPSEIALGKMVPFLNKYWGTPSAPHHKGQELFPAMEVAYRSLYQLFGASEQDDVIFTSSGAEAVNQAIFSSYCDISLTAGKNQFLASSIDEAPTIMSLGRLERFGCVSKLLKASPNGYVEAQAFADYINPRTALLSLSWANGLTGVIQPLNDIVALCKDRGIRFHLDCTHALGKLYFDLGELGADILTMNGTQIHGLKGSGAICIREHVKMPPFIVGGLEQGGRRAGDVDVASLVALGAAAEEALQCRDLLCTEVARLRNKLEEGISAGFPDARIFFRDSERLPHCTAIGFPGIANEALLFALNKRHVYASIGGGTFQQLGLILEACGINGPLAHSALSFSLSRDTTESQIERAVDIIVETAHKLRKVSLQIME